MTAVKPDHGGWLELVLESTSTDEVVYTVELATPTIEARGRARVAVHDGGVAIDVEDDAPKWLVDVARAVLRTLWRGRDEAGWPRRVTRWRAGPEGG